MNTRSRAWLRALGGAAVATAILLVALNAPRVQRLPTPTDRESGGAGSGSVPPTERPGGATGRPAAGTLREIGPMSIARAVATATSLADGRVLVAGGCSNAGCDLGSPGGATAEVLDPLTETFSPTGDLTGWRDDHVAVRLPDGRVLLIGGWGDGHILASTDLYDPASGTFRPGPSMQAARSGPALVTLEDGRVLVAGGFVGNRPTTAMAEVLDPSTLTFMSGGSMVHARGAPAAALLADGRVLVAGGLEDGLVVATAEIYDPATGTSTDTGSMAVARYKGAAVPLPDGRVLVFGGSGDVDGAILYGSSEIFDPANDSFSPGPSMAHPRYKVAESTIRLASGDYLISAGAPEPELLSVRDLAFVPVRGSLGATRLFLAAAAVDGGRVLLVGGYDRAIRPTDQAWIFDADGG